MNKHVARLTPFIMAGVALVAFAFGLLLLAYLLIVGAVVGLVLFSIAWLRDKFFPSKVIVKKDSSSGSGRTIDHKN